MMQFELVRIFDASSMEIEIETKDNHTLMLIFIKMVQTTSVEGGRTTNDTVNLISFAQKELGTMFEIVWNVSILFKQLGNGRGRAEDT